MWRDYRRTPRPRRRPRRRIAALATLAASAALVGGIITHLPTGGRVATHGTVPYQPDLAGEAGGQGDRDGDSGSGTGTDPRLAAAPGGFHLTVPILVYHYVRVERTPGDAVGWGLSVTPHNFSAQMDYLRAVGAHTLTLAAVLDALDHGRPLPSRAVVLTFDDGYADFATDVTPILHRDGLIGTDFVVSGFVGRTGYMSRQQVLAVAGEGMVIGAHTVHHLDLPRLAPAVAQMEIEGSKKALEALTQHPVEDFAYPYGGVDHAVEGLVSAAGFHDGVTMAPGDVQYGGERFGLRRVRVGGGDTLLSFAEKALVPLPSPSLIAGALPVPPPGSPVWAVQPTPQTLPRRGPVVAVAVAVGAHGRH